MNSKNEITLAIDFTLKDTQDREIHLADFWGQKAVLLVLMRGFA
jgi:peroxiredoxin